MASVAISTEDDGTPDAAVDVDDTSKRSRENSIVTDRFTSSHEPAMSRSSMYQPGAKDYARKYETATTHIKPADGDNTTYTAEPDVKDVFARLAAAADAHGDRQVLDTFKRLDTSQNGRIGAAELHDGLAALGCTPTAADERAVMAACDADANGTIDYFELAKQFERARGGSYPVDVADTPAEASSAVPGAKYAIGGAARLARLADLKRKCGAAQQKFQAAMFSGYGDDVTSAYTAGGHRDGRGSLISG